MPQCTYCKKNISIELERMGGNCPSCHKYILPLDDFEDDFATELIIPEHIMASDLEHMSSEDDSFDDIDEITEPITEEVQNQVQDQSAIPEKTSHESLSTAMNALNISKEEFLDEATSEESSDESSEDIVDAISKVPVILMDIPRDDLSAQHGYVFDEDSDEGFLIEAEAPKSKPTPISPVQEELSTRPVPKKPKGLDFKPMIFGFVLMMSIIGLFWISQDEGNSTSETFENIDMHIPDVKKGALTTKEEKKSKTPRDSSKSKKNTEKSSTAQKSTSTENLSGIETFSTSAPVGIGPTSSLPSSSATTDRTKKDIENLFQNLSYCHTQALKKVSSVSGKWELSFTIDEEGKAKFVKVTPLRKANSEIESCIKSRIARFKFSPVQSSVAIKESIIFG